MIERLRSDALSAVRALRNRPLLVAVALLTLALSAGVNLALFGLIDRALLRPPLRVEDPARIYTLAFSSGRAPQSSAADSTAMVTTSYVDFAALRDGVPAFEAAAAFQRLQASAIVDGEQRSVQAMWVSGEYFELLGTSAWLGRGLEPADNQRGAAPSVVVSHAFWSAALHGDRGVLGRRLVVRGIECTVVGVMPRGFSGHSTSNVDVWVPFASAMAASSDWDSDPFLNLAAVVVRLGRDQTKVAATTQAERVTGGRVILGSPAGENVSAIEKRVAWCLAGLSVLVLAIGLANAATLLVVRAKRGRGEAALRAALGASRSRLVTEALAEALLFAGLAMAVALGMVWWMDETLRRVLFAEVLGGGGSAGLGGRVGWGAFGVGLVAAATLAMARISQLPTDVRSADLGRSRLAGERSSRGLAGLLLVQTALSVLLLVGAGLFGASLYRLKAQDFGLRWDRVSVVDFAPGPGEIAGQDELFTAALERVRQLPGVERATLVGSLPFSGFNVPPIGVPGGSLPTGPEIQLPFLTAATPEFLDILGIRVVQGRGFDAADERGAPVVLVNRTMADTLWPGESALGKCIRVGFDPDFDPATFDHSKGPPVPTQVPCREVVGVTRDVRQRSVLPAGGEDRLMQYFVPFSQVPIPPFADGGGRVQGLLVLERPGTEGLAPVVRRLVVGARQDLPFLRVRPYAELLAPQLRPWTLGTRLFVLFAGLALAVAAIGLYAAFAHVVVVRRREIAVRLAVGARPRAIRNMVIRRALALAATGVVLGGALAVAASSWLRSLLFQTQPFDPVVLAAASVVMLTVTVAATAIPAWVASSTDPGALLRSD